jgi:hypothetical protein
MAPAAASMPSALYTLAYEDFQYYYTLYCQETGAQQWCRGCRSVVYSTASARKRVAVYVNVLLHASLPGDRSSCCWCLAHSKSSSGVAAVAWSTAPVVPANALLSGDRCAAAVGVMVFIPPYSSSTAAVAWLQQHCIQHIQNYYTLICQETGAQQWCRGCRSVAYSTASARKRVAVYVNVLLHASLPGDRSSCCWCLAHSKSSSGVAAVAWSTAPVVPANALLSGDRCAAAVGVMVFIPPYSSSTAAVAWLQQHCIQHIQNYYTLICQETGAQQWCRGCSSVCIQHLQCYEKGSSLRGCAITRSTARRQARSSRFGVGVLHIAEAQQQWCRGCRSVVYSTFSTSKHSTAWRQVCSSRVLLRAQQQQ